MNADMSLERDGSQRWVLDQASDESLITVAKQGLHIAFEEVCNRYSKRVFATVYRITKNREDAEDAYQEAALRAFVHLKSFDGRAKFCTWFTKIAINSALLSLRQKR